MNWIRTASEPGNIAAANTLHNLGVLSTIQREAKEIYEEALARKEKHFRPYHPSTIDTVNELGKL